MSILLINGFPQQKLLYSFCNQFLSLPGKFEISHRLTIFLEILTFSNLFIQFRFFLHFRFIFFFFLLLFNFAVLALFDSPILNY